MTELGLIVGIDVVGLALALLMARRVSVRDAGTVAMRRLGSALERAAQAFLWQAYRSVAGATLVLVTLSVVLSALVDVGSGSASRVAVAFWAGAGLCLGAFGATLAGHVGALLAVRGSVRTAAAAGVSVDSALGVAMRTAGSVVLFSETLSGLLLTSLFGLLFAIRGGFALPSEQALPLAQQVVLLLPNFALGAAVSALVLQRGGGAFHAASGVGSDQAGERDAGLDHDDARNPAVVAELLGDHLGASATRSVDGFVSASVANVAALIIFAALSSAVRGVDPLLLLVLPLVVRAFGVIASTFGVFLVRSQETSNLSAAWLRGYLATSAIACSALGGISYWLFNEHFWTVFASAALGMVSVLCAAHVLLLRLVRRSSAIRDGHESLRLGGGALTAAGLAAGLETALLPVAILAGAITLSVAIGAQSGMPEGTLLCPLMFTLGACCVAPFVLSLATVGSIADGARGVASMSQADGELRRRSARLDDAGFSSAAVARQYAIFSGALSSLLVAWAIAGQSRLASVAEPRIFTSPALAACGAVGAVVVLAYAGSVARSALRGAREVAAEIERQLRGFPRENGTAQVPADFTPSYRTCVELGTAAALRRGLVPIAYGIAAPLLVGIGLRLLFRKLAPELVAQGLSFFVLAGSLTGLSTALAVNAACLALSSVRRANRGKEGASAAARSLNAAALSDVFGNAAAPALELLVKATAAVALLITPFLI